MIVDESLRRRVVELFPHLDYTHWETKFQLYWDWNDAKQITEVTVFYRQPDAEKRRVDGLYRENVGVVSWQDSSAIWAVQK